MNISYQSLRTYKKVNSLKFFMPQMQLVSTATSRVLLGVCCKDLKIASKIMYLSVSRSRTAMVHQGQYIPN